MFITEELSPGEMLAELLRGRRVRPEATERFAKFKHNADLCPKFTEQVTTMLDVYRAYGQEAHDIQGFQDDGVDILLKYEDRHGESRRAGLQIKSEDEFIKWEKKTLDLPKTLKAQYATAIADAKVNEYYLVLCADAVRHRDRIRMLKADLKNFVPCTIIDPTDALGLFEMNGLEILARVTRLLCQRDKILNAAIHELDGEVTDVAFFLLALMCWAFDGYLRVTQDQLFELWYEWEEFAGTSAGSQDQLSDTVGTLVGSGVLEYDGSECVVAVNRLPPALCALYFDQKVRITHVAARLRTHLIDLLDLRDRLEPPHANPNR
jgi:hypothetical protein